MELKTVNGLGRKYYVRRAYEVAMDKAFNPTFVEAWAKWFDEAQADPAEVAEGVIRPFEDGDLNAVEPETACAQCVKIHGDPDSLGMCGICPSYDVVADMPQPEYYLADLEEVAAMQTSRIEQALLEIVSNGPDSEFARKWVARTFAELQNELKTPGYVEGLIPE